MKIWAWMSVAVSITLILLVLSNVPVGLTDLDREYAATISAEYHIPILSEKEANDFSAQMDRLNKAIKFFDDATLDRKQIAIPQGDYRELDAWYAVRSGICSDVSRAAEKFLTYLGFHVRHVSVYTMKNNINPYSVVLTYRNPSHAVAEVLTSKGWMMFDPHFGRLYLDVEKKTVSTANMYSAIRAGHIDSTNAHEIFSDPYVIFYGLYSRHGMFYPPFVPVPDIAWLDFIQYRCCEVVQ